MNIGTLQKPRNLISNIHDRNPFQCTHSFKCKCHYTIVCKKGDKIVFFFLLIYKKSKDCPCQIPYLHLELTYYYTNPA